VTVSPAATTLPYERPDEDLRAQETAAVWRVGWLASIAWAIGILSWFGSYMWEVLSSDTGPWRWFGWGYFLVSVGLLACAFAIICGIARARPGVVRVVGVTGLGLVLGYVFFQTAANVLYGSMTLTARAAVFGALIWVSRGGGLLLLTLIALRPSRATAARLALFAAAVLLAIAAEYGLMIGGIVIDSPSSKQALENLLITGWLIEHARYGLILAAAVTLILASRSASRQRWPLVAAGAIVVIACFGASVAQYTVGFWGLRMAVTHIGAAAGATLVIVSPGIGLLAWRPPPSSDHHSEWATA
jgi:hypothetical protein